MNGWEGFSKSITDESSRRIAKLDISNDAELNDAINSKLFNTGESTVVDRKPTKDEEHYIKIFYGYLELDSSFRTLKDIEVYLSSCPYRNPQITKPRHLRYHVESYFNEVYILKERLISYLTIVGRCYKGDKRHSDILSRTKPLFGLVNKSLKGVVQTRGSHVHYKRFDSSDLDRLDTMYLFTSTAEKDSFWDKHSWYFDDTYRQVRSKWKNTVISNNKQTLKLLDFYGDTLKMAIFNNGNKQLKYPRTKKA